MRELLYQKCSSVLTYSFSTSPITTAAWVELDSSMDMACVAVEYLNTSSAILKLSIGAAAAEDNSVLNYYLLPGKSSPLIPLEIAQSKRLSAKAVGTIDADIGDLVMNFFG